LSLLNCFSWNEGENTAATLTTKLGKKASAGYHVGGKIQRLPSAPRVGAELRNKSVVPKSLSG